MIQKSQNIKERYHQSGAIVLLGISVLVFVIRVGILLQKSESDLLSISKQIRGKSSQTIPQKSHVKVVYPIINTNGTKVNTGTSITGINKLLIK